MKPKLFNGFMLAGGAAILVMICGSQEYPKILAGMIIAFLATFYIYTNWEK